jgi:hypothetical protein
LFSGATTRKGPQFSGTIKYVQNVDVLSFKFYSHEQPLCELRASLVIIAVYFGGITNISVGHVLKGKDKLSRFF